MDLDEEINDIQHPVKPKGLPNPLGFNEKFVWEIALGVDKPAVVAKRYGVTKDEYIELHDNPIFRQRLADYTAKIAEDGVTVKMLTNLMMEQNLHVLNDIIKDPTTPPGDRIKAMVELKDMAGLSTKNEKTDSGPGVAPFVLQMVNLDQITPPHDNLPQKVVSPVPTIDLSEGDD